MYQAKDEVIERIFDNEVTVLLGETGSGKSTQLPQLIYDHLQKIIKQRILKLHVHNLVVLQLSILQLV